MYWYILCRRITYHNSSPFSALKIWHGAPSTFSTECICVEFKINNVKNIGIKIKINRRHIPSKRKRPILILWRRSREFAGWRDKIIFKHNRFRIILIIRNDFFSVFRYGCVPPTICPRHVVYIFVHILLYNILYHIGTRARHCFPRRSENLRPATSKV